MSLVEVSPSTVTRLKVRGTTSRRASESISRVMAQSVVTKHSMVPMLGWIMPEPLAMAPSVTVLPPIEQARASSFFTVSVVMMAVAASVLPCSVVASLAAAAGMPLANGSMTMGWPMTPVEAGRTSSAGRSSALPTSSQHSSARATPLAAQVLALPLLTRMACA